MAYEEKNTTVSLVSHLLIVGYYLVHISQMLREGGLVAARVFSLFVTVIIAAILVNIIASILTNIVLTIVHAIRTQTTQIEKFTSDERDRLISLKGTRAAYITFSLGVLAAMITFMVGQPPLVMFSLIVFFSIAAQIVGDLAQVVLYRRGF